jgi:hypothetical protein
MEMKQYKMKIRDQLLNGIKSKVKKERAIAEGTTTGFQGGGMSRTHYKIPKNDYDNLLRQMSVFQGPMISMPGHIKTGHELGGNSIEESGGNFTGRSVARKVMKKTKNIIDDAKDEVEGGKFHFVKALSKAGKEIGHELKKTGLKVAKRELANAGKQLLEETLQNSMQNSMQSNEVGGKFHFGRSLSKVGKKFGHELKKAGINAASQEITDAGVQFAKNNMNKFVSGSEAMLPEALPIAEEAAPMMLMAAGMKKPKRTRQISEKEKNRHALIRKLMQKHGCGLAQASAHIKKNNLSY